MIRIISFTLLTLMLSCANTSVESAAESNQKNTPEPTTATAPEAKKMAPLAAQNTHIPELKLTPKDNGAKSPAKPAAKRKTSSKVAPKAPKVTPPVTVSTTQPTTPATVVIPTDTTSNAVSGATQQTEVFEIALPETATTTPTQSVPSVIEVPSILETPSLTSNSKRAREKHFLPTRRRIDREINKNKFAYKGEVMMGLTASYGTLSSDDTDFMLILDNIDADGTIASVKPFIGYFYRDNNCLGVRFGYNHVGGSIKSLNFDLGSSNDVSFEVPYVNLTSDNYSFGIFHRSYAGLDPKGRFGLFAEFELAFSTGSSDFTYKSGDIPKSTFSDNTQVKLSFNPGAAVYIFPNVCATLSFGLGGLQYTSVTQKDDKGKKIGSRESSNMKFKLNIAAINFGMTIHLWDKKK